MLSKKKQMEQAARSTRMYHFDAIVKPPPGEFSTNIQIINGDCLEVALWLKRIQKCNPACLNMASRSNPGGGYRNAAGAQEENLHRRTSLFHCLDDPYLLNPSKSWSYPLPEFGGIYVKDAVVFRESEAKGYAFLEQPDTMSFVGVFAYSNPPLETNEKGELRIGKKIAQHTKKKIEAICCIALEQGHDSLVLSAFGCGAYGNPPKHMAQLFKEVLNTTYKGAFKNIAFSIFDDHNTGQDHNPEGNLAAFEEVFGKSSTLPSQL